MVVGELGWPVGSWRLQDERLKFPPGEQEGFRLSATGTAFVARIKRAREETLRSNDMIAVVPDEMK